MTTAKRSGRKVAEHGFPLKGNPERRHLHAMIPDELDEWVRAAAIESGRTLSEIVEEALDRWLEQEGESCQ